ncbi:hypothetical protein QM027_09820 [Campylobacter concisus]
MLEGVKIVRKDVKNITLKVRPSGEAILTAPKTASDEHIKFHHAKKSQVDSTKARVFCLV